ncbi:hypothetical protein LCGC14_0882480 [marine sediment metagenome]|uniref:Uncharacterized protein n=1 Tax=marine sediment metagenome TaxID=412755 RepID=A0A0F9P6F8_9ZZZZ
MSETEDSSKTGFEKIIDYFNETVELNHPIAIAKIVEDTRFSWSFVKKTLTKINEEYDGFHFEKSGNTWITWKDRDHIIKKLDETCSRFLNEPGNEC